MEESARPFRILRGTSAPQPTPSMENCGEMPTDWAINIPFIMKALPHHDRIGPSHHILQRYVGGPLERLHGSHLSGMSEVPGCIFQAVLAQIPVEGCCSTISFLLGKGSRTTFYFAFLILINHDCRQLPH